MMKYLSNHKRILLLGLLLAASAGWAVEEGTIKPGVYDGLMLAVDKHGIVSGYYKDSQDGRVCNFFLNGHNSTKNIPITSRDTETFPGTLRPEGENVKLQISKPHPGCHVVGNPEIFTSGATLEKTLPTQWTAIRIVKITRTSIFSSPSEKDKTKLYLIKDDALGVVANQDQWTQVEYYRAGKSIIKGWVKSSDILDPFNQK